MRVLALLFRAGGDSREAEGKSKGMAQNQVLTTVGPGRKGDRVVHY